MKSKFQIKDIKDSIRLNKNGLYDLYSIHKIKLQNNLYSIHPIRWLRKINTLLKIQSSLEFMTDPILFNIGGQKIDSIVDLKHVLKKEKKRHNDNIITQHIKEYYYYLILLKNQRV